MSEKSEPTWVATSLTALELLFVPKYSFVLWSAGAVLFVGSYWPAGNQFLTSLDEFRSHYGQFAAPITVVAFMAWIVQVVWAAIVRQYVMSRKGKAALQHMYHLSEGEIAFFKDHLKRKMQNGNLDPGDEDWPVLQELGILVPLGSPSNGQQPFKIADYWWKRLTTGKDKFLK
jgi:hypothetical protein